MKYYYTVADKNMTELELVNTALDGAGVRPKLYKWLPERGYIEQWLGDYNDLWTSELTMYDLRHNVAAEMAKMHSIEIPDINKLKVNQLYFNLILFSLVHRTIQSKRWLELDVERSVRSISFHHKSGDSITPWPGPRCARLVRIQLCRLSEEQRLGATYSYQNLQSSSPVDSSVDYPTKDWAVGVYQSYYNWTERAVVWYVLDVFVTFH